MATSTVKWSTYSAATTYLSSELDALADAGNKLGGALDNTVPHDMYSDWQVYATAAATRDVGGRIDLYFLPSVDGTNYAYGDDSVDPSTASLVGSMILPSGSTSEYSSVLTHVLMPAGKFKALAENQTGAALGGSASIIQFAIYNETIVS